MYNLSVELENVQAIKHAVIKFGSNGITEFIGDNSNCKSALSRVIEYMTSGDLKDKETRESLINDNENEARILFAKDEEILALVLRRERSDSYVLYNPDARDLKNPNIVVRNIGDPGHEELISKFGFRAYDKGNICLQVCPTFGAIPFITTKGRTNMEIVNDITSDKVAEEFLDNFEKITNNGFKGRLKTLNQQKASLETLIDTCVIYDYNKYKELSNAMGKVLMAVGQYYPIEFEEIPIPPDVDIIDIPEIKFEPIPIFNVAPIKSLFEDLSKEITELNDALDSRCPTCGRLFE